jgi:hypothetical protein
MENTGNPNVHTTPQVPPPYPPRPSEGLAPPMEPLMTSPHRKSMDYSEGISSPVHYTRDPHKLIAYLVPFPKPDIQKGFLHKADAADVPTRFLIYTPPPPPLKTPKEGEKEAKFHKVQRKWQQEVREAKTSNAKITSWKGVKGRVTKGVNTAMGWTTTSSLDFLNRVPANKSSSDKAETADKHAEDGYQEGDQTSKTVGLEELVLIYPSSLPGSEEQIRQEFVGTMLRSKSKAERDAVIATGLLPVSFAIDMLAMIIWPFGGLLEVDGVWAYSSIRGAKTARSVTKRLHSTSTSDASHDKSSLKMSFSPSPRLDILDRYLAAQCHERDPHLFPSPGPVPSETDVLEALGWSPSHTDGETKNWEDEQWEIAEVKDDLKNTMRKGSREWDKWCKAFKKDPVKALKK